MSVPWNMLPGRLNNGVLEPGSWRKVQWSKDNPYGEWEFVPAPPPEPTPSNVWQALASAEQFLPASIRISAAGGDAAAIKAAKERYINENVRPAVEQAKADAMASGAGYGSFAGGMIAGLESDGKRYAEQAAQDEADRQLMRWDTQRKAFMAPAGGAMDASARSLAAYNDRLFGGGNPQQGTAPKQSFLDKFDFYASRGLNLANSLSPYLAPAGKWAWNKFKGFAGFGNGQSPMPQAPGVAPVSGPFTDNSGARQWI